MNAAARESLSEKTSGAGKSSGAGETLKAMRYSFENGGKRIRPVLTLEFCRICGGDFRTALPFALGVEAVHAYSLIHDDLPCMDDDDFRRGKPSNHKVFGEARAVLAGDALLTFAFEIVLSAPLPDSEKKIRAALVLAKAAGRSGMIAGQVMDLANAGGRVTAREIDATNELKTGELIKAAAVMGCVAAGAGDAEIEAAERYCKNVGAAFQIIDDVLDATSEPEILGKPAGSDVKNKKATCVSALGLEEAIERAKTFTKNAKAALHIFGGEGEFLREFADRLARRKK